MNRARKKMRKDCIKMFKHESSAKMGHPNKSQVRTFLQSLLDQHLDCGCPDA